MRKAMEKSWKCFMRLFTSYCNGELWYPDSDALVSGGLLYFLDAIASLAQSLSVTHSVKLWSIKSESQQLVVGSNKTQWGGGRSIILVEIFASKFGCFAKGVNWAPNQELLTEPRFVRPRISKILHPPELCEFFQSDVTIQKEWETKQYGIVFFETYLTVTVTLQCLAQGTNTKNSKGGQKWKLISQHW